MITVHRYELQADTTQNLVLPEGSQVLSVGVQDDRVMLWCRVDTQNPLNASNRVLILATGQNCRPFLNERMEFYGTVFGRGFVFHVFGDIPKHI